jgi:hypothetical protein
MRCETSNGETWTTVRVREMRERLGIADFDPAKVDGRMISLMKAAEQIGICVGSAKSLVLRGDPTGDADHAGLAGGLI